MRTTVTVPQLVLQHQSRMPHQVVAVYGVTYRLWFRKCPVILIEAIGGAVALAIRSFGLLNSSHCMLEHVIAEGVALCDA